MSQPLARETPYLPDYAQARPSHRGWRYRLSQVNDSDHSTQQSCRPAWEGMMVQAPQQLSPQTINLTQVIQECLAFADRPPRRDATAGVFGRSPER